MTILRYSFVSHFFNILSTDSMDAVTCHWKLSFILYHFWVAEGLCAGVCSIPDFMANIFHYQSSKLCALAALTQESK